MAMYPRVQVILSLLPKNFTNNYYGNFSVFYYEIFNSHGQATGMGPKKTSFFLALNIATKITKDTIEITSDMHLITACALAPLEVMVPPQNTRMGPDKTSFFQALNIATNVALIPSKPLRNKIFGFITHLMKSAWNFH